MKKKQAKPTTQIEVKPEWKTQTIEHGTDKFSDLDKKITLEVTRDELYAIVTGLYSTFADLDRRELKAWKEKAAHYRSLAMKFDYIYDKTPTAVVYTCTLNYAK